MAVAINFSEEELRAIDLMAREQRTMCAEFRKKVRGLVQDTPVLDSIVSKCELALDAEAKRAAEEGGSRWQTMSV